MSSGNVCASDHMTRRACSCELCSAAAKFGVAGPDRMRQGRSLAPPDNCRSSCAAGNIARCQERTHPNIKLCKRVAQSTRGSGRRLWVTATISGCIKDFCFQAAVLPSRITMAAEAAARMMLNVSIRNCSKDGNACRGGGRASNPSSPARRRLSSRGRYSPVRIARS
jgi:hypothetical protein